MGNLIQRDEQSSHWYKHDGEIWQPAYEMLKKDGTGMRPVTLRDAKLQGLVPSVTNVLSVCAKPGLQAWKQEQCVLAALTLPRKPDEGLADFARRVIEDAEAQSLKARELGTRIHAACEDVLKGRLVEADLDDWVAGFRAWADINIEEVYACESYVGDRAGGFAGRLDLHCRLKDVGDAVVDYKTQAVKSKPAFYIEWARQLAAYAHCITPDGSPWPALVSVVINTAEPGPVFVQCWETPQRHWESFQHCHALWCDERDYWPQVYETQQAATS